MYLNIGSTLIEFTKNGLLVFFVSMRSFVSILILVDLAHE
jgi:hypothetical protein